MKCPVCRTVTLEPLEAESQPRRLICAQCGGYWIAGEHYWQWLRAHGENLPERVPEHDPLPTTPDSPPGKLCPQCGRFLTHAAVGHGIRFHIDRCGACGGFWFDRNEWETLEAHNLQDDAHFIFSTAWQHAVAEEEARRTHEQRLLEILGPADYARVAEFAAWVRRHPKRGTILAHLTDAVSHTECGDATSSQSVDPPANPR